MRALWTLFKVIIGLAIAIPVGFFVLTLAAGVLATALGLAFFALRLAIIGFVGYGLYRVARSAFGKPAKPAPAHVRELPPVDPYYEAAVRELDSELGTQARG